MLSKCNSVDVVCFSPHGLFLVCHAIVSFLLSSIVELQVAFSELVCPLVLQDLVLRLSDHLVLGEVVVPAIPRAVNGPPLVIKLLLPTQIHLFLLLQIIEMIVLIMHLFESCIPLVCVDLILYRLKVLVPSPSFHIILDQVPF